MRENGSARIVVLQSSDRTIAQQQQHEGRNGEIITEMGGGVMWAIAIVKLEAAARQADTVRAKGGERSLSAP